jgi:OOP family OmpA-OmpF porin
MSLSSHRLRRTLAPVLAVLLAAAAGACGREEGAEKRDDVAVSCDPSDIPEHDSSTLVIEGDPWSGYAPFRDPDLLESAGSPYKATYVEQLCQDVRAADISQGRADIMLTTLDQYLLTNPAGTVVGVVDQSRGADALVLDTVTYPYLKSEDDLRQLVAELAANGRGRPVLAYTANSPSEMLLNELANTVEELHLSDFDLEPVDQSATALAMLQSGEAQVAIVWEPDTSAARDLGYTIALSSEDVPDSIVDVIVASNELILTDPEAVQAVVTSFYRAMDEYLADRPALEALIADDGGLDADQARSVIDGIKLYGSAEADAFMNENVFPLDQPLVERSINAIGALLALLHPSVRADEAEVDGRFVQEVTG